MISKSVSAFCKWLTIFYKWLIKLVFRGTFSPRFSCHYLVTGL